MSERTPEYGIFIEQEHEKPKFQYDIIFMRHAERKELEDALTEKGREASRRYGQEVKFERLAARHSGTRRTSETISEIYASVPQYRVLATRTKKQLHPLEYYSQSYITEIRNMLRKGKRRDAFEYNLAFEDRRPDEKSLSGREVAAQIAKLLRHYLNMSKHFKPDTKLGIVNVSHDFVLTPFIARLLQKVKERQGEKRSMKDVMTEAGGELESLEGIRFTLAGDDKVKYLKFNFRGQEYSIDENLIDEIVAEPQKDFNSDV